MIEVNERGPMKKVLERYTASQMEREKRRLAKSKYLKEQNLFLINLQEMNQKFTLMMQQNQTMLDYLEKLTNGPGGQVHYIRLIDYTKNFGEVFIDFVRGEKDRRSKLPVNSIVTYPYSKVFMVKITNDGPADIRFSSNRHAMLIDLKAGESDTVSENESFEITELRIANITNLNANVRIVVYA